jgi:serine/threonine-protein kinase
MAKRSRLLLPALILAIPLIFAHPAFAESTPADKAAATVLFNDAKKLLAEGRVNDACPKFEESQKIDPTPGTLLNLGDCYERSTPPRTASAWGTFKRAEVMARNGNDKDRQEYATKRMLEVEPKLSKVTIHVAQDARIPGLDVKWDGKPVGDGVWDSALPVDAGEHAIEATAPGKKIWTASVRVAVTAGTMTVDIPVLGVAPVEQPKEAIAPASWWTTQRKIGVAVAGVGVVGVVLGSVFGAKALGSKADAVSHCGPADPTACDAQGLAFRDDARGAGHVSTAAFAVGGAAVVAGVVLIALGGPSAPPASGRGPSITATPVVSAGMTGLVARGEF